RDFHVTGVQTCALPILLFRQFFIEVISIEDAGDKKRFPVISNRFGDAPKTKDSEMNAENAESILLEALLGKDFSEDFMEDDQFRSEERRVGKECRVWWW